MTHPLKPHKISFPLFLRPRKKPAASEQEGFAGIRDFGGIGSFFIWGDSALPRESANGRSRRNGRLLHFYRNGKEGYVALAGQKQARLEKQDADLATSGPPQKSAFNAIFPLYNLRLLTRNLHFFALLTRPDLFLLF